VKIREEFEVTEDEFPLVPDGPGRSGLVEVEIVVLDGIVKIFHQLLFCLQQFFDSGAGVQR